MCNLYSMTKGQKAIRDLVTAIRDLTGNMPPLPAIFPDKMAPVFRTAPDGARTDDDAVRISAADYFRSEKRATCDQN
jgi:hypothetical protein